MANMIFKLILILINVVFLVIGLALTACGVIIAFVPNLFMEPVYTKVKEEIAALSAGRFEIFDNAEDIADLPLFYQIGIGMIVVGSILTVIAFLGCFGSCCSCCRCFLVVFAIIVLLFMVIQIVGITLFLVDDSPIHDNLRSSLKDQIPSTWDETSTDSFVLALNLINHNFGCCGIDGVSDFDQRPWSCGSNTEGCYTKLQDLIHDRIVFVGVGVALLLLLQLVEVILAIVIYKGDNKVSPQ